MKAYRMNRSSPEGGRGTGCRTAWSQSTRRTATSSRVQFRAGRPKDLVATPTPIRESCRASPPQRSRRERPVTAEQCAFRILMRPEVIAFAVLIIVDGYRDASHDTIREAWFSGRRKGEAGRASPPPAAAARRRSRSSRSTATTQGPHGVGHLRRRGRPRGGHRRAARGHRLPARSRTASRRSAPTCPRAILLYGLPGCGKTLLARALAGETGVPFYFVSATSFVEKFVGLGAARVRQLFEAAKRDGALHRLHRRARRHRPPPQRRRHRRAGVRPHPQPAARRARRLPGRLGRDDPRRHQPARAHRPAPCCGPGASTAASRSTAPTASGREKILRLHADARPISRRVDWAEVAAHTAGLTAAELANIVNEGCLLAARRHRDRVAPEDVDEAVSRVLAGTRSARLMSDEEKQLVGRARGRPRPAVGPAPRACSRPPGCRS